MVKTQAAQFGMELDVDESAIERAINNRFFPGRFCEWHLHPCSGFATPSKRHLVNHLTQGHLRGEPCQLIQSGTSRLRDKMLEHLEAALAIADETQDEDAGNLIERALDFVRAAHWPTLDPNLAVFCKGRSARRLGVLIPMALFLDRSRR